MEKIGDLFIQKGTFYQLSPTDSLFFHSEDPFYCYLESGEIDLFFLETKDPNILFSDEWDHVREGTKLRLDFFRSVKPGSLIFSLPLNLEQQVRMIAFPSVNSRLYYLTQAELFGYLSVSQSLEKEFLDERQNWLNEFSEIFQYFSPPRTIAEVSIGKYTLNPGDIFICRHSESPEKKHYMFWLKVVRGAIEPLGLSHLLLTSEEDHLYPVTRDIWWKSVSSSEVEVFDADTVKFNASGMASGWNIFYKHLLEFHSHKIQAALRTGIEQLSIKKMLMKRNLRLASDRLHTVLDKEEIFLKQEGTSLLFDSCQLVGNQLGLKFDSEADINPSLTLKEKVEELSFNSMIYFRLVNLLPNWWNNNIGPFLGFSKDETKLLPLIPKKEHYSMIDLEQIKAEKVNKKNASTLFSHAFEFFRSFPLKEYLQRKDLLQFAAFGKKGTFSGIIFISFLISLLNLFFPFINSILFDVIIPIGDKNLLIQLFIGMILIISCNQLFVLGREYMILKMEGVLDREFEGAIWQRILDLPLRFFRSMQIGEMLIQIFAVGEIRKSLSGEVLRVLINSFFSLIYLIPMLYYSVKLTLVGLLMVLIGIAFSAWAVIKNLIFQKNILDLKAKMNNQILQLLTGISKIRIAGAENLVFVLWEKIFYPMKRFELQIFRVNNIADVVNFAISNLGILVIYAVCILSLQNDRSQLNLTTGQFLAFLSAFGPFSHAVNDFSNIFLNIVKLVPLWNKSQALFKTAIEIPGSKISIKELTGNIHLDHVSFRYDKNSPYILQNLSIQIKEGEFIGIVGHSGCGKSTLIKMLIGFEKPESGAIYYDNYDISLLDMRYLRRQLGIVLQTSSLIDGTIQENISTSGFYTEEDIRHALHLAGFEKDLKKLPMGVHTLLMDKGNTLSGGQRQRLIIARALVGKPKVLIFDEATSALDNATQELITENLEKMSVTRIVIAHRLTRLRKADKIYVLDHGGIVDTGTFEELASREGIFLNLLNKQKVL